VNCSSCGAPLPAKSNVCRYCTTLNETDLRTVRQRAVRSGDSALDCPRCPGRKLVVLHIPGLERLELDRCESCHGIFFDPGELEAVLDRVSGPTPSVDRDELERLVHEERAFDTKVVYLRCPACGQLMDRRIHARKSGVIADRCAAHGLWLDGGELGALAKWARAGGREHDVEAAARERERAAERARLSRITRVRSRDRDASAATADPAWDLSRWDDVLDVLGGLFR